MKIWKKALSVGLSLALCAGLVAPALAVTYDIGVGNVYVENDDDGVYSYQGTKSDEGISRDKDITVIGTTTKNTITVGDGVTDTTITLSGVNISVSSNKTSKAAMSINGADTDVTVELDGENTLKSGDSHAGLELNDGASVTIQDKNKDGGSLTAIGGYNGAGIGGIYGGTVGNITITDGGTVTATGGQNTAGIGSGMSGTAGDIKITGGSTVTATGSGGGAGVGAGMSEFDQVVVGNITIEDSTVTATGGNGSGFNGGGAGIGGGDTGNGIQRVSGGITISGSTVTATGGRGTAGIGSGYMGAIGDITIRDSKVTAMGGTYISGQEAMAGAGIGGGYFSVTGDILIDDNSDVTATGGINGAGIGAGSAYETKSGPVTGKVGTITIDGGSKVTATGTGSTAAGIGEEYCGTVGKITIRGGSTVIAKGDDNWSRSSGIAGEDVIITGGSSVEATGAYGISGGIEKSTSISKMGANITIDGRSEVMATGATIGLYGGLNTTINDSKVTATGSTTGMVGTNIDISKSTVTATGNSSRGIDGGAISIQDGSKVIATGKYGFHSRTVDISRSDVLAIGSMAGIYGYSAGNSNINIGDGVTLLALSGDKSYWGTYAFKYIGTNKSKEYDAKDLVTGNILVGKFDNSVEDAVSSNSVFTVLDKDGNVVREFDVNWEGKTYYSFAIDLPESGKDYIIVQKDADGNILNYLVYKDNMAVYGTKESEDGSVDPMWQDGLVLKNVKTEYEFKGDNGKELPKEVTDQLDGYAAGYDTVDAEGGKWVFQGWTNTDVIDENGKLQDVTFTGTWGFDGYNYTVEFNPNNGQQSTTASGKVDETTPDMPDDPAKGGYTFVGWVDKDGNVITSFEDYIPSEDGEKVTVTALWVGKDYNVIVDPNGGSLPEGSEPTIPGKVGEDKPELPEPTRPGYDFDGWVVVDKDGNETEFDPDDFDPDGEDVHLKAKWDGDEYTVTVDPDNGEEPETQTGKVGGDTPEKPAEPTKNGHKFTGWEVVDEEGNPIVDKDGNPVDPFDPDFIPDKDGQKIIVKATWEKLPSRPTGGGNGGTTPTTPTDPTDPTGPVNPDPEEPVDIENPETPLGETPDETVDIEDPETPLGETPDETVDIEDPETPLGELPEASDDTVEIDGPDVPLSGVPQTGEASTAMWLAVLLACGMGLVYVNTGKRKENA